MSVAMMRKRIRSPFSVNWTNLEAVINYASTMGPGISVVQFRGKNHYNIIHTEDEKNLDSYYPKPGPAFTVLARTGVNGVRTHGYTR